MNNGQIHWYNIDFKDVINHRDKFAKKNKNQVDIVASALDSDWCAKIEHRDNALVIAEVLLMYFSADEIKSMYDTLSKEHLKTPSTNLTLL